MANSVIYQFKALNKFTNVSDKIGKSVTKLDKKFKKLNTTSIKDTRQSIGVTNQLSSAFGRLAAAAAAYFSVSQVISKGSQFQDSLADLSSITGSSGEQLEFLSEQAFKLARSSNVAQAEVVRAFTDIASAKSELLKDPKAIIAITEQSLLLANAAGIAVPDAVQASVGALNQFNVGADQAARFVNVLAAGSKVGAARVSDIVESMKNAGPVAAQFNVSFEETNAMLQVLAKNGIKAAEAGTGLRQVLVKLEKIADGKLAPSKIGVIKSLDILSKAGLTNSQIIKEFGEEALKSILIFRENLPLIKQWKKEMTGTSVAQEQAAKRLATFNAKFKKLKIIISEALIKTFLKLEPVLTKQVEKMSEFLGSLKDDQIESFANKIKLMIDAGVMLVKVFSKFLSLLERIGTLIGEVAGAFATLDFSKFSVETKKDLTSIGTSALSGTPLGIPAALFKQGFDKFFKEPPASDPIVNQSRSTADVNINLNAPKGTVQSVKSKTSGKDSGLNVGVNMESSL